MTRTQDEILLDPADTLESLWEQFERTGSVQTFLKYQQLASRTEIPSED